MGEIEMSYLLKMATCDVPNSTIVTRSIVNLAVLQNFFNDSELGQLQGDTLLDKRLQVRLPEFRTYEHEFKNMLANDETNKYNLQKFAKRVKNDSVVYHHLADVVAEQMQKVNFQDDYFSSDFASTNLLVWVRGGF